VDPRIPITVAIARFDDLVALGLRVLLTDDPSVRVVAHDIAYDRLPVILRALRPGVLILDVDELDHAGEVRGLRAQHPLTHLVLLSEPRSSIESAQLLAFGASACLPTDTQSRDLLNAIHLASRGLQLMPLGPEQAGGPQIRNSLLTPREGDVLLLLGQGLSNAQIAVALEIGIETVRSHARNVFRKLGVSSRRALIALATPPAPRSTLSVASHQRHRPVKRTSERRPLRR
jgi:DNA-binding NarL/FixJ family response regulator